MGFKDRKLEIAMVGLAVIMVGALGHIFKAPLKSALPQEFSFEMPRPKAFFASLFDLGGREVERNYKNPFEKNKKTDAKAAKADGKGIPAPALVAQVKKAPTKKDEAKKDSKVSVNIVSEAKNEGLTADTSVSGDQSQKPQDRARTEVAAADKKAAADGTALTDDQWRALIRAQPSKENIDKLAQAYSNKEVSDSGFYAIVTDLLSHNQAESQKLGVYALSLSYSAKSFALASQYYDQLALDAQGEAHTYLVSYATTGRHSILTAALESGNAAVVEVAAGVVIEGYQKSVQNGVNLGAPPRESRGDAVASGTVADYSKFVPIFQRLAQSGDATIAQLASVALGQIQTSVAAL